MQEPITPGFPPRRSSLLDGPPKLIRHQGQSTESLERRVASLERLLTGFSQRRIVVKDPGGQGRTVEVISRDGGVGDLSGYGSMLQPREFSQTEGKWTVVFYRARFVEHSLAQAGTDYPIKAAGATMDTDPVIPISGKDQLVWLKFDIDVTGSVKPGTPELVFGDMPARAKFRPARPESDPAPGTHVQHVGTIIFQNGSPGWMPANTSAMLQAFSSAIESIGDGERLYGQYQASPPVDKWRSVRGQNGTELEAVGWPGRLEEEWTEPSFRVMEVPTKITVEVVNDTLVISGTTKIPVPAGLEGTALVDYCNSDGEPPIRIDWKRGVASVGSLAGQFIGCSCSDCTSSNLDGP